MIDKTTVIILAAGLGKRMKSGKAKVLHEILGKPMILYVTQVANQVADDNVVVVVGHQAERVRAEVDKHFKVKYAFQEQQLGTGHAVQCALPFVPRHTKNIVILCGDVPLLKASTIETMINDHKTNERDITVLAVTVSDPSGYGRMIVDQNGDLSAIVEEADANKEQKKINLINSGIFCVQMDCLKTLLLKIKKDNAQNEMYLTDIVKIGCNENKKVSVTVGADANEVIGVNSLAELARAEAIMRK